jgi:segregation and condensation protein A
MATDDRAARAAPSQQSDEWERDGDDRTPDEVLVVALDGFEGPLDLLLSLARKQKVDLTKVSVLALAEQYLSFIAQVRGMRLEIAADYLVMAAWLAYLKSRLLLPKEEEKSDEPSGQELAAQLAFRLKRLEAMREAVKQIMSRRQLGVDVFARGMPEGIRTVRSGRYTATLYDLLHAYADQRKRTTSAPHQAGGRTVWSIGDGRQLLTRLVGPIAEWAPIEQYLADYLPGADEGEGRSALASTFGATLELTREGFVELRQATPFGPIHLHWLCEPPVDHEAEDAETPPDQREKIA